MNLLANKVVLLTGGSRGIGRAIALHFASEGAHIAFSYLHSHDEAAELRDVLVSLGVRAACYRSNASDFTMASQLVKDVVKDFGSIDILVNNAGICDDNILVRMSEEQWDTVIDTNLKSVFNLTRGVVKIVMRARGGVIVNVSSVIGISGNTGQANYAASKAGIIGFTKSIARELAGHGIRANAVAPGFIETDMTNGISQGMREKLLINIPVRRTGSPEDVARACLFLASADSSYITGQVIQVDGGMVI